MSNLFHIPWPSRLLFASSLLVLSAVIGLGTGVFGLAPVAVHADGPSSGGSSPSQAQPPRLPLTAGERALGARKQVLAQEYVTQKNAGAPASALQAIVAQINELTGTTSSPMRATGGVSPFYAAVYLSVTTPEESTSYYCGPASGVAVLNWVYSGSPAWNGDSVTQSNLAKSNWLKTDANQETDFYASTWVHTLNSWTDGTDSGWYELGYSPSSVSYENDMVLDIDNSYPLVDDVYTTSSTGYLVGYSSGIWYHYVVGSGYGSYGGTTTYDDPYDSGSGSLGRHYGFSNTTMVSMLGSFGIVW